MTTVKAYKDSNGVLHETVEGWQLAEMQTILKPVLARVWDSQTAGGADNGVQNLHNLSSELIAIRDILLNLLTTGPRSRPSTRKRPGTTSPKRAAKRATPAQAVEEYKTMREAVQVVPEGEVQHG